MADLVERPHGIKLYRNDETGLLRKFSYRPRHGRWTLMYSVDRASLPEKEGLIERLRAYDSKASLIDRLREHDLSSYPEDDDWQDHYCDRADDLLKEAADRIAALEAEASEGERLWAALTTALALIDDYLTYRHDGDPWSEDARLMGEMEINYAAKDGRLDAIRTALIPEAPVREGWLPIETAPKDGTVVDLWHEEFGRQADFRWGHTEHCCGEAERYCDSDWHSEEVGWVDTTMNERFFGEDVFTHWRSLPAPPQDNREG